MKTAIILHGPPCVGKSTVKQRLMSLVPNSKYVNLDAGWQKDSSRIPNDFADLKGHQEEVLIVELALGAPHNLTPGATERACEWVELLRSEGRKVLPFLLWMDWEDANLRMTERHKADLGALAWITASYAWYEHSHYLTTFPAIRDFSEERILTTNRTPDEVAQEIIAKAGIQATGRS